MGTVSEEYGSPEGRKSVDNSWSPTHLLTNLNGISIAVLAAALVLILIVVALVRRIIHRRKRP